MARNKHYNNKNSKRSMCSTIKVCQSCYKIINLAKRKHECSKSYCQQCRSIHEINQICMMRPLGLNKTKNRNNHPENCFMFYDFERRQDTPLAESMFIHTPNICVVQLCCDACGDENNLNNLCLFFGVRQHIYEGDDCQNF